jgi:hypothetical protein
MFGEEDFCWVVSYLNRVLSLTMQHNIPKPVLKNNPHIPSGQPHKKVNKIRRQ